MAGKQKFMKVIAFVFAFVFAFATMAGAMRTAAAEGENNPDSVSFMTLEGYEAGVNQAVEAFSQYLQDVDGLTAKIQSAYFLVNYAYISEDLYHQLVEAGYIAEVDMYDDYGTLTRDNPDGWINIDNFRALRDAMSQYNIQQINKDYFFDFFQDGNTMDVSRYIDPSVLCAEEHDRETSHLLFEKWYESNLMHSALDNESLGEAHGLLTALAATEEPQGTEVSLGARWLIVQTTGRDLMSFLTDRLINGYSFDELEAYFDPEGITYGEFILKDDIEINPDNMSELEYIVYCYGQEWDICYVEVDTELFAALKNLEPIEEEEYWEFEEEEEEGEEGEE